MRLYYFEYFERQVEDEWNPSPSEAPDDTEYETVHIVAGSLEEAMSLFRERFGDKEVEAIELLNPGLTPILVAKE